MPFVSGKGRATGSVIAERVRWSLGVAGGLSWLAGCAATFFTDNGPGAVALVATGAAGLLLGLIGQWPQRIGVSGSEVSWPEVRETVSSAIAASESDPAESATEELRGLLGRLEQLRLTGSAPAHPADQYDRAVEAAVRRLFPLAVLTARQRRLRTLPDFEVELDGRTILLETKWRQNPERPMGGSTLPELVQALPPDAVLIVVSNANDVSGGRQVLRDLLPLRGYIVSWKDTRDDTALAKAFDAALASAGAI